MFIYLYILCLYKLEGGYYYQIINLLYIKLYIYIYVYLYILKLGTYI